jgi:hypothetical protein
LIGRFFETYKQFISLVSQFFSGYGEPWITETMDTDSKDKGAHLYIQNSGCKKNLYVKKREHFGDLDTDGRILLSWCLRKNT